MERPLFSPPLKIDLDSVIPDGDGDAIDSSVLYNQIVVDRMRLQRNIDKALELQDQISLGILIENNPLEEGLAELVVYFTLAEENPLAFVNEDELEKVFWVDNNKIKRSAEMPVIMFQKGLLAQRMKKE